MKEKLNGSRRKEALKSPIQKELINRVLAVKEILPLHTTYANPHL